jgi:SpoVK/Ycf46/Vps4 family AAA+-type ATPase
LAERQGEIIVIGEKGIPSMNRLKSIQLIFENNENDIDGKQINAEHSFARIQGLGILLGEATKQNSSKTSTCKGLRHTKYHIDNARALHNVTKLFKRITQKEQDNTTDFEISQYKQDPNFSSLTSSLSDQNFLLKCLNMHPHEEHPGVVKDFSFNTNTIKPVRSHNIEGNVSTKIRSNFDTNTKIKSARLPVRRNDLNTTTNPSLSTNPNDFNINKPKLPKFQSHKPVQQTVQQQNETTYGFTSARDKDLKDQLTKRNNLYGSNARDKRKSSNNNDGNVYNKWGNNSYSNNVNNGSKKTLGLKRRPGFQPPRPLGHTGNYNVGGRNVRSRKNGGWNGGAQGAIRAAASNMDYDLNRNNSNSMNVEAEEIHPRLKCLDPALVEQIENEILKSSKNVEWDDIAGLEFAKRTCQEIVVMPILCPEMFQGLRKLPKGLLLFGPPGTGKTMIGKAIASQTGATFFSISASSLTSKWIGQGEKLVRALFGVAAARQPSVIFIDEIDSLLTQRASGENEASRRIKTEFLIQLDGAGSSEDEKILVLGATNRPQELDEAARRRFMKRLYIPLPNAVAREALLKRLLTQNSNNLTQADYEELVQLTKGYSGSDLDGLCREAAMAPLRDATQGKDFLSGASTFTSLKPSDLRPIVKVDLLNAIRQVRASVGKNELEEYKKWNAEFGSFVIEEQT